MAQSRVGTRNDFACASLEAPFRHAWHIAKGQAVMPDQVIRRRRFAAAAQIIRRGADNNLDVVELAGNQARVFQRSNAKGNIDTFIGETYRPIHQHQIDRDLGLLRQKAGQHWRQPQPTEQRRSADMQSAGRCSRLRRQAALRLGNLLQNLLRPFVVEQAGLSQREMTRGSLDKRGAEELFSAMSWRLTEVRDRPS